MTNAAHLLPMRLEQDQHITATVRREQSRLRSFIRRRVANPDDAEDILQDVFYRLVEANRLLMPVEHVTGWLYRVARNAINDLFRRQRRAGRSDDLTADDDRLLIDDLLPSPEGEELERAVDELPQEQRLVFIAHEFQGRSFKEMAEATGVSVNTLLSRKRYAVLHLRDRLQGIYDEFMNE
jgi:RNA polymerase sigma factor (sigma-70 family)